MKSAPKTKTAKTTAAKAPPSANPRMAPLDARLEEILARSPSPFSDAVLANAFRETPDVPSIHATARQRALALVHSARDGKTSLQAILGEAGEGKTHLISWLRRQSEEGWRKGTATGRFALTVIPPMRSFARARHHVLQELVRQLSVRLPGDLHVDEATDTPIEILLWRALLAIAKVMVDQKVASPELRARLEEVTSENPDRFLSSCVEQLKLAWKAIGRTFVDTALKLPELAAVDRDVFRVVARFPEGDEPERTAIVDWLGGGSLSTERLEALGTQLVLDDEPEAARGLKTLLALAQFAATPVALAFDQIEGIARLGADGMNTFLDTVTELYNEAPGTVILVFCQTQLWPALTSEAAQHVKDRLDDSPPLHLKALTPEEALLLVETRMRHFWDGVPDGPKDSLYPLSRERVLADVVRTNLRTPRAVVRHFQSLLREAPATRDAFVAASSSPPADIVRRKLDALVDEERKAVRPPDARAALTQAVTQDLLQQAAASKKPIADAIIEEVSVHRARKTGIEGIRVTLRRNDERKRVYLESSNSQHGKSAASTIKRLSDVVAAQQADVGVLLREEAFPLPRAASKALVEMTSQGVLIRLAEGEVAPLAAIEALLNAAAAGDIPVDRKTALDIAVEHLQTTLGLQARVIEQVFPHAGKADASGAEAAGAESPGLDVPPSSLDPRALDEKIAPVLRHLRNERAFEPAAHLATSLGMTIENVHLALRALEARGLIDVVVDRNRSPVVLLRPEGLVS